MTKNGKVHAESSLKLPPGYWDDLEEKLSKMTATPDGISERVILNYLEEAKQKWEEDPK